MNTERNIQIVLLCFLGIAAFASLYFTIQEVSGLILMLSHSNYGFEIEHTIFQVLQFITSAIVSLGFFYIGAQILMKKENVASFIIGAIYYVLIIVQSVYVYLVLIGRIDWTYWMFLLTYSIPFVLLVSYKRLNGLVVGVVFAAVYVYYFYLLGNSYVTYLDAFGSNWEVLTLSFIYRPMILQLLLSMMGVRFIFYFWPHKNKELYTE